MKKVIGFALILLSLSSHSQTEMERATGLDQWATVATLDADTTKPATLTLSNATWGPSSVRFMGVEINNEYMRIDSAGNLYYRPSAFCKCDTGNSMKFLLSIFKPERKNLK